MSSDVRVAAEKAASGGMKMKEAMLEKLSAR